MREVLTVLSINEDGWRRGRGESNGNGERKSRLRLLMPSGSASETAKEHGT